jgi:hypothetical protein
MESTPVGRSSFAGARTGACLLITLAALLWSPLSLAAAPADGSWLDQTSDTATLTIYLSLTTVGGQPAGGSLSGYTFTLNGPNGASSLALTTDQLGQAAVTGLDPGVYSLTETPPAGASFSSMTINGVAAMQQQPFQIQAGGNYNVNVINAVSGSGNVNVQVQLVDQSGQPLANANLSGFSFAFTSQSGASATPTVVNSSMSGLATLTLSPGPYAISETAAPGASLINYVINGVPTGTGQFTLALGQSVTILANNRAATANVTGGIRAVTLSPGCNNVASTFPDGTTGLAFVSAISPATSVSAVWRFDNSGQTYRSVYFPTSSSGVPEPIDVSALNRFDALWVCVSGPATLSEPNP